MRGILITVSSASTRLNNKCYKPIKGRPTIEYVIEQAKSLENQTGRLPTGREQAGCWIRSDSEGNPYIGWKIGNKFVWFQDGQNLYRCSANWESDFRDLKKQVSDGVHDKAIEDCFNRPNKTKSSSE